MHITASWKDWWKRQRKLDDPAYLARHHLMGSAAPDPLARQLPHGNLVVDPIADWSNALQQFHSWQLSSGFDLLRDGMQPQTASDLQNVNAAKEHQAVPTGVPPFQPMPPQPVVFDRPWHTGICDPMSTIPGGPGSMGPVR